MRRSLPVLCPSVGDLVHMETRPCTAQACDWWKDGCTAQDSVRVAFAEYAVKQSVATKVPVCPLEKTCRWALDAGGACAPKSFGTLCQHQGGEYNTWFWESLEAT